MTATFAHSTTLAETMLCLAPKSRGKRSGRGRILAVIIVALTSLSMLLASFTPVMARDRDDDLAKALAAAIALGIIVNHLDRNKRHDRPAPTPARSPRVPASCAIEIDGNHRSVTVYTESCLRKKGFDYQLPRNCAKTARVYGRADRIYGVQCLRSAGFRVAGY